MRHRSAPQDTLSECLARLRSLPRATWPPVSDRGHAAVVAVLFDVAKDPTPRLLLTRRANLRSHSGEVALPGGRRDPEDEAEAAAANRRVGNAGGSGGGGEAARASRNVSTVSSSSATAANPAANPSFSSFQPLPLSVDAVTALREAHEEIGLEPSSLEVVAELPPLLSKHLLSVAAVVAVLKRRPESVESLLASLRPSPSEVDAAFEAPLADFLEPTSSSAAARSAAGETSRTAASEGGPAGEGSGSGPCRPCASRCSYSHRDARFGRVASAPRFRLHFFDMRDRPCVFSENAEEAKKGPKKRSDDFLVWGLTAGIAVGVAEAALGRPPAFEVSPPRTAPYSWICSFRHSNGGMPTVMRGADKGKVATVKKRKR